MKQLNRKTLIGLIFSLCLVALIPFQVWAGDTGPLHGDGTISGQLTDQYGKPLAGISLAANFDYPNEDEYLSHNSNTYDTTDENGYFALTNLLYGDYTLYFYGSNNYPGKYYGELEGNSSNATVITVDGNPIWIEDSLYKGISFQGTLTIPDGHKAYYVEVCPEILQGDEWQNTYNCYYQSSYQNLNAGSVAFKTSGHTIGKYRLHFSGRLTQDGTYARYRQGYLTENGLTEEADDAQIFDLSVGDTLWNLNGTLPSINLDTQLSGTITNAYTGRPIYNGNVFVYRLNEHGWYVYSYYNKTNDEGVYYIDDLPDGEYKLRFDDGGESNLFAMQFNGNFPTLGGAPQISINADSKLTVDANLEFGSVVTGQVELNSEKEIPDNIYIDLYRFNDAGEWIQNLPDNSQDYSLEYNEKTGHFAITGLRAGRYRALIRTTYYYPSYASYAYWLDGIEASNPEGTSPITVGVGEAIDIGTIPERGQPVTLTGVVTKDDAFTPLPNMLVTVHSYSFNDLETYTDKNGRYTFDNIPVNQDFRVHFSDPTNEYAPYYSNDVSSEYLAEWINSGNYGQTIHLDQWLFKAGSINGTIAGFQNNGSKYGNDVNIFEIKDNDIHFIDSQYLQADGTFSFNNLPPNDYIFYVSVDYTGGFYTPNGYVRNFNDATSIRLNKAETVELNLPLPQQDEEPEAFNSGRIHGIVTDEAGTPLNNTNVYLYKSYSGYYWDSEPFAGYTTFADGAFSFTHLPVGLYRLGFKDSSGKFVTSYYNNTTDFSKAETLQITASTPEFQIQASLVAK